MKIDSVRVALIVVLSLPHLAHAQFGGRAPGSPYPCPGGGAGVIDTITPNSLAQLVSMSDLIVTATVTSVLPSSTNQVTQPALIMTTSLLSVTEVLMGPPEVGVIAITQLGGETGGCRIALDQDPLFERLEEYMLFLTPVDESTPPRGPAGVPRYAPIGVWSGKVRMVDGAVRVSNSAAPRVRRYDGYETERFRSAVVSRIEALPPGSRQLP